MLIILLGNWKRLSGANQLLCFFILEGPETSRVWQLRWRVRTLNHQGSEITNTWARWQTHGPGRPDRVGRGHRVVRTGGNGAVRRSTLTSHSPRRIVNRHMQTAAAIDAQLFPKMWFAFLWFFFQNAFYYNALFILCNGLWICVQFGNV